MKKTWRRILSGTLCLCMIATIFTGCGDKNKEVIEEEKAVATSVVYNDAGQYTTTITSEKLKLSGVTADKLSVIYDTFDSEAFAKAAEVAGEDKQVDKNEYNVENEAAVTGVKENEDGTLTVSFTDEKAKELATAAYEIRLKKPEVSVSLAVEQPDFTFTPNVEAVSAYDKAIRLTLALNDSEYEKDVKPEQIELGGSFSTLKIDSLSSAGKNLTMQLTGEMKKDESAGVFLDGFVRIDREAIVNAANVSVISIPVTTNAIRFSPETLNVNGETVTAMLNVYDDDLLNSLTAKDISFEKDVTVRGYAKINDSQAALIMSVKDAKDKNTAAAVLNGQTVKVGNNTLTANFALADFYPVFDYVEANGDSLNFTLMLYASNGKLSALENNMITLAAILRAAA